MFVPKWNIESVRERCNEINVEYLSSHYKHDIKGLYRCLCGETFERLFTNVNKGQTLCRTCFTKRDVEIKEAFLIKRFAEFKEYVEVESKSNCRVLATPLDYKSNKSKLKLLCTCNNIFTPTANNFYRGHQRCHPCSLKSGADKRRLSEDEIRDFVQANDCRLVDYSFSTEHRLKVACAKKNTKHPPYEISYANFYAGHRCPVCKESKGEKKIKKLLLALNVNFEEQFGFEDLRGNNNRILRFDFAVKNHFGDLEFLLEYDGEQHFKPKFGEKEFKGTVRNDNLKNKYCKDKQIRLLRIPYTEFDNISDILIENMTIPR